MNDFLLELLLLELLQLSLPEMAIREILDWMPQEKKDRSLNC